MSVYPYPTISEIPENAVSSFRHNKFPGIQTRIFGRMKSA